MKKLILLSAVLLGAVSASQAGIRFSFGIGIPFGPPVVACPAPVYVTPPVYQYPPQVVYQAPAPVVYAPPPVVFAPAPSVYVGFGPGWYRPNYGWGHYRGWEHARGHGGWHR
ncbi:MAG TPA: hypothetical protein VNZ64_03015 [Candidatus Acidoferrum sp.]|nr:hypothetical protein [Candidatus Acidoferrum sp.]